MNKRLFTPALVLILCLATLAGRSADGTAPANGSRTTLDSGATLDSVVVRVTSRAEGVSFEALFQTEKDTLVFEKNGATPARFVIDEKNFKGLVRPKGDTWIKVAIAHGGLNSGRTSQGAIGVVKAGDSIRAFGAK